MTYATGKLDTGKLSLLNIFLFIVMFIHVEMLLKYSRGIEEEGVGHTELLPCLDVAAALTIDAILCNDAM